MPINAAHEWKKAHSRTARSGGLEAAAVTIGRPNMEAYRFSICAMALAKSPGERTITVFPFMPETARVIVSATLAC